MIKNLRVERVLLLILCILMIANLVFTLQAREIKVNNYETQTVISHVPYIITQSGNYVLGGNLTCNDSKGTCIEIQADHVTLNLLGYTLRSSSSDLNRSIYGIYAKDRSHITITNGMVEGFFYGIYLEDVSREGRYAPEYGWHTIKDIVTRKNTFRGIRVEGLCNTVTNNIVSYTGGTVFYKDAFAIGIESIGSNAYIIDNRVFETYATANGEAVGISFTGTGDALLARGNMIVNTKHPTYDSWGIWASGDTGVFVTGNRIYGYNHGLGLAYDSHGSYDGNLVYGAKDPYRIYTPEIIDGGNNQDIQWPSH